MHVPGAKSANVLKNSFMTSCNIILFFSRVYGGNKQFYHVSMTSTAASNTQFFTVLAVSVM